jgi:hypothetical protein
MFCLLLAAVVYLYINIYFYFQPSSRTSSPPKWMADLENDDINLLQGMLKVMAYLSSPF